MSEDAAAGGETALHAENAQLRQRISELEATLSQRQRELDWLYSTAFRDPVTGFWARQYLNVALERTLGQARTHKQHIGIVIAEIDQLERVNEAYGYDAGDALLRAVGAYLHQHIRNEDIVCRLSKEFAFILPNTPLKDTQQRAEQMRRGIRGIQARHRGRALGTVTFSVGVASFPEHGTSIEILMKAVSFALYWARVAGRDNVVVFESDRR
jgi:diguanylate cyclase (GGDEF)-like protein